MYHLSEIKISTHASNFTLISCLSSQYSRFIYIRLLYSSLILLCPPFSFIAFRSFSSFVAFGPFTEIRTIFRLLSDHVSRKFFLLLLKVMHTIDYLYYRVVFIVTVYEFYQSYKLTVSY